jgi:hypothetical protein
LSLGPQKLLDLQLSLRTNQASSGLPEESFETGLTLSSFVAGDFDTLCKDRRVITYKEHPELHQKLFYYAKLAFTADAHPLTSPPETFPGTQPVTKLFTKIFSSSIAEPPSPAQDSDKIVVKDEDSEAETVILNNIMKIPYAENATDGHGCNIRPKEVRKVTKRKKKKARDDHDSEEWKPSHHGQI